MTYLETRSHDPHYNLAVEEYVFKQMHCTEEYFMLWRNKPSVIIGRYQNMEEEINRTYAQENGIDVVRRITGGGAVYHDMGNLNFTYIVNCPEQNVIQTKKFTEPVLETLRHFGVEAQCTGRNDITIDGSKISGSAQFINNRRLLYHGCIMLDTDLNKLAAVLTPDPAKFESKSTKSVRSRVMTINQYVPNPIPMKDFMEMLYIRVMRDEKDRKGMLSPWQLSEVEKLCKEKYSTWEWNYGQSIPFTMSRKKRFSGGLVEAYLKVDHGIIEEAHFRGDFFCNGDIKQLEDSMKGIRLDGSLEATLERFTVQEFFSGISAKNLAEMLR